MDPDPGYMGKKVSTEFRDQLRNGGFIDKQYKLLQFDLLQLGCPGQKKGGKDMDCGVYLTWYLHQVIIRWKQYMIINDNPLGLSIQPYANIDFRCPTNSTPVLKNQILNCDLFRLYIASKILESDKSWLHNPWKKIMDGLPNTSPQTSNHLRNVINPFVDTTKKEAISISSSVSPTSSESSYQSSQSKHLPNTTFQRKVDTTRGKETRNINPVQPDEDFHAVFEKSSINLHQRRIC